METYDYEEGRKINERRIAIIEDSLTRSLLYDRDKGELSRNGNYGCLIYITIALTVVVSIIVLVIIFKSIKN